MTQNKQREETVEGQSGEPFDPVLAELKKAYDDVTEEPLPQNLLMLLDKLDKAERSR